MRLVNLSIVALGFLGCSTLFSQEFPGVLLQYGDSTEQLTRDDVSSGDINYFGWRRGPYIENKFSAYRFMMQSTYTGSFDPYSKSTHEPVLHHLSDNKFKKGHLGDFGSDVLHVGSTAGLAGALFYLDGKWHRLPKRDATEGIRVEVLDPSPAHPSMRVSYLGWKISESQTIDVILTARTAWEDRFMHCTLETVNFTGDTAIGMTRFEGAEVSMSKELGSYVSIGPFATREETMLLALQVRAEVQETQEVEGLGTLFVVEPGPEGVISYSFMASWEREPTPYFASEGWRDQLTVDLEATKP